MEELKYDYTLFAGDDEGGGDDLGGGDDSGGGNQITLLFSTT